MEPTAYKVPKVLRTIFFGTVGFLVGMLIIVVLLKIFQHPASLIFGIAANIGLPIWIGKKYHTAKDRTVRTIAYGMLAAGIVCIVFIATAYTAITAMFRGIAN